MVTTESVVIEVVSSFFDDYRDYLTEVTTVDGEDGQEPGDGLPPPPMMGPPPSNIGLTLSVVYSSLIIVTNVVTLCAFAVERRLRTYNNFFLISLAIADLLVGFMVVANIVNIYYPTLVLCKLHLALNDALLTVSVFGIVAICVDRHQATYDPITHFTKKGTRRALMYNTAVWALSFAFWLPYTVGWDLFVTMTTSSEDDPFRDACVPRYGLRVLTSLLPVALTFLLPAILIAVLYFRIIYKIRTSMGAKKLQRKFLGNRSKANPSGKSGPEETHASGETGPESRTRETGAESRTHETEECNATDQRVITKHAKTVNRESSASARKATRTLSFIVVAFVVAWVPHVVFLIVTNLDRSLLFEGKIPAFLLFFISLMRYTNSFLNPISYAVAQPLFRKTVFNMFICKCPHS